MKIFIRALAVCLVMALLLPAFPATAPVAAISQLNGEEYSQSSNDISPGGKIAFRSESNDGFHEIFIMNADGSQRTQLTHDGAVNDNREPCISRDGSKIVYSSYGTGQIWVINSDGTGQKPLTDPPSGKDYRPSWSPDGKKIVFQSTRNSYNYLYIMDADGSNLAQADQLATGRDYQWPSFNSTGTGLLFYLNYDGKNISTSGLDGSNVNLIGTSVYPNNPVWSPDGSKIAFDASSSIYTIDPDGSHQAQIGSGADPAWSPDSKYIAYCSTGISIMDIAGNNAVAISNNAYDCEPSWGNDSVVTGGNVFAWGLNSDGQLGLGMGTFGGNYLPNAVNSPVQIAGLTNITAFSGGNNFSLALDSAGNVFSWGGNDYGQLGLGNTTGTDTPTEIPYFHDHSIHITAISAGYGYSLALDSSGKVWAWGRNYYGTLGNGGSGYGFDSNVPQQLSGAINNTDNLTVTGISAGYYHALALDSDQNVWAWGCNSSGQLGNDPQNTPVTTAFKLSTISSVIAIEAGGADGQGNEHSLALKSDGSVWAWGSNAYGQVGKPAGIDNGSQWSLVPVQVTFPADAGSISAISAGGGFNVALDNAGYVWAWGEGDSGQLGDNNSSTTCYTPVRVVSDPAGPTYLSNITAVAASKDSHVLALDSSGNIWSWGANGSGQLGLGDTNDKPYAYKIPSFSGVTAFAAGFEHSLASSPQSSADAAVSVNSSVNPSVFGQSITLTATVTGSGGTPTGTVTLNDGNTDIFNGNLDGSGKIEFTTTNLDPGTGTISVVYSGDTNYKPSSASLQQTVNLVEPAATLDSGDSATGGDRFGSSVAIDGTAAIIGSPGTDGAYGMGLARIYTTSDGGQSWTLQAELSVDGSSSLGASVAIKGDIAVVSDPGYNNNMGAVYVYTRSGYTWDDGVQVTSGGSNGTGDGVEGDFFGTSLAIDGNATDGYTLVVGAPGRTVDINSAAGTVYVFTEDNTTSPPGWNLQAELTESGTDPGVSPAQDDSFGCSVAIRGNNLVAGASGPTGYNSSDADPGAAYVFTRTFDTDNQAQWTMRAALQGGGQGNYNGSPLDFVDEEFGAAVAINNGTIAVGDTAAHLGDAVYGGAVFIFSDNGDQVTLTQGFMAGDRQYGFGRSLAIDNDKMIIGATENTSDGINDGAAYIFTGQGNFWTQQAEFIADSPQWGDGFGWSVAESSGITMIGIPGKTVNGIPHAGQVYVYASQTVPPPVTYTITTSVPGGHGTAVADPAEVVSGGSSTITLTPSEGYHLSALTDNNTDVMSLVNDDTYTINNITADHTIMATFAVDIIAGDVYAWGGGNVWGSSPVSINFDHVVSIAADSSNKGLALKDDGTVWMWTTDNETPVQVSGLSNIRAISAGYGFYMALDSTGNVWAWGNNYYGTLGNGSTTTNETPGRVKTNSSTYLSNITSISAGAYHAMALNSSGHVWAWGSDQSGQSGPGSGGYYAGQLTGLDNVIAIDAGGADQKGWDHSMALKNDGTVWAWGANNFGQIGKDPATSQIFNVYGDSTQYLREVTPIHVNGLNNPVTAISAGGGYSLALDDQGNVWAWGANGEGQLGNNSSMDTFNPVEVVSDDSSDTPLSNVTSFFASKGEYGDFSLALDSSGKVWSWGHNVNGQLGLGDTDGKLYANQIPSFSGVIAVTCGSYVSLAIVTSSPVIKMDTSTSISSAYNPSTYGQSVTFTATVTSSSGTPTGPVTFLDGETALGTGTLDSSGITTYSTSALDAGDHSVTAVYGGDSSFNGSTSTAVTQTVDKGTLSFSNLSSPTITQGTVSVTLSGTISGTLSEGDYYPSGESVSITLNSVIQNATIDAAGSFSSTFDSSGLAATGSPYDISYNYAGNANYNTADGTGSLTVSQVPPPVTYTITTSVPGGHGTAVANYTEVNSGGSATVTLTPAGGYHLSALTDNDANVLSYVSDSTYRINNITADHFIVATFTIDALQPATNLVASDPDNTNAGVDGRDFHISWTPSISAGVTRQEIYILPESTSINTGTQTEVAGFDDNTTDIWNGDSYLTTDSAGGTLAAGNYRIYVVTLRPSTTPGAIQTSASMTAVSEGVSENHTPVAVDDAYSTSMNTTLTIHAPGILRNDTDADHDSLHVDSWNVSSLQGTVVIQSDGSFVYNPPTNWTGVTSFTYKVWDYKSPLPSAPATVTITVNHLLTVNPLPVVRLIVNETITVSDSCLISTPVEINVEEAIGVTDSVQVSPSTSLNVAEQITVNDQDTVPNANQGGDIPSYSTLVSNSFTSSTNARINQFGYIQEHSQLNSNDNKIKIDIAAGTRLLDSNGHALPGINVDVINTPPPTPPHNMIILAYSLGPQGATFDPPLTVTFKYPEILPRGVTPGSLYVAYFDGDNWQPLKTTVDIQSGTLTAKIAHFSSYAVMGKVTEPGASIPSTTLPNNWPIIVGVIAAIAIIVSIIYISMRRRLKKG